MEESELSWPDDEKVARACRFHLKNNTTCMKDAEISVLITQGRAYKSSSFLFKTLKNKDYIDNNKELKPLNSAHKTVSVAFLTPKKAFKKAVLRNKARRRAQAAFSSVLLNNKAYIKDISIIFMLSPTVLTLDMTELKEEVRQALQKSGIIAVS